MADFGILRPTPNYLEVYTQSYQQGRETRRQREVQNALASYEDDPAAAEGALTRYGETGMAETLRQRREREQQQQNRTQIAGALSTGDFGTARTAAAGAGDLEAMTSIDQLEGQDRERAQRGMTVIANLARGVKANTAKFPTPEARRAFFAHLVEEMVKNGQVTPQNGEKLAQYVASQDWSDAGIDQMLQTQQAWFPTPAANPVIVSRGAALVDPTNPGTPLFDNRGGSALDDELTQARIDELRARAARARRPPASGGGRGGSGTTSAPGPWAAYGGR